MIGRGKGDISDEQEVQAKDAIELLGLRRHVTLGEVHLGTFPGRALPTSEHVYFCSESSKERCEVWGGRHSHARWLQVG